MVRLLFQNLNDRRNDILFPRKVLFEDEIPVDEARLSVDAGLSSPHVFDWSPFAGSAHRDILSGQRLRPLVR